MPDRQSSPTSRAAAKKASANSLWAALRCCMFKGYFVKEDVKWDQIHSRFKELVKRYHPDKNQGDKKFEEKLKKITLAYSQLKKTLGKK